MYRKVHTHANTSIMSMKILRFHLYFLTKIYNSNPFFYEIALLSFYTLYDSSIPFPPNNTKYSEGYHFKSFKISQPRQFKRL